MRIRTHVEPVSGVVRHADQITLFAQHLDDTRVEVQGEQARASNEEAHFVLAVAMFIQKFLP